MGKPWWELTAPEVSDGVGNFLSGWAKDRGGDVKAGLGIRDPENMRDPISRGFKEGEKGNFDAFEEEFKNVDPDSLSPEERSRFREYSKKSKDSARQREYQRQDEEYRRFFGPNGYKTQQDDREFARATAMNRENLKFQDRTNQRTDQLQRDLNSQNLSTQMGLADIGAGVSRDQMRSNENIANISGMWGFKSTDRNAQAQERIASEGTAADFVSKIANNEMQRDANHLQHKAQRSKMLLDAYGQGLDISTRSYAPIGGYKLFK